MLQACRYARPSSCTFSSPLLFCYEAVNSGAAEFPGAEKVGPENRKVKLSCLSQKILRDKLSHLVIREIEYRN
jgi:hypothetical protein